MKKITWIVLMAVSVLLLVSPSVNAFTLNKKEPMRGLTCMEVVVEIKSWELKNLGLTEDMIKTDIESKLQIAGIKISSKEDPLGLFGTTFLYSNINAVYNEIGFFTIDISIELRQEVYLKRNPNISFYAITWNDSGIECVEKNIVVQRLRSNVKKHVDNFLNDYLSVNPIQQPTTSQTPQKGK